MLCARPWLAELPFVAAPHGPNWLSWVEAVVEPLSRIGLNAVDTGEMLSVIDGYTRGASDTAISLARARARGTSDAEWAAAVGADLEVMARDARKMRGDGPVVFAQVKHGVGVGEIAALVLAAAGLV